MERDYTSKPIAEDWEPSTTLQSWFFDKFKQATMEDLNYEHEQFVDYYLAKNTEKTTGMPPSDFGVGALSSWVTKHRKPGTILNQPEFLPVMLTQSDLILIDTIARATSEALLELKDHKELAPLKKKLDGVIHQLEVQMQPAPNETIVKSLQVLGNTFKPNYHNVKV